MFNQLIEALVADFSPKELADDLTFAMPNLDIQDRAICEWVACAMKRHIELLPGSSPTGERSSLAELLEEIQAALEGDSSDAEHDALVSVAQRFGLAWTAPDA
jgi:hypothetical protein